jgi:hypothetical protein
LYRKQCCVYPRPAVRFQPEAQEAFGSTAAVLGADSVVPALRLRGTMALQSRSSIACLSNVESKRKYVS